MKNLLLLFAILNISISLPAKPIGPSSDNLPVILTDTLCRDTIICIKGDPFNLNLLCRPTGGVYYGSQAILGDQFNPAFAGIGANLVFHGFIHGNDTIACCSFIILVKDTVAPAGIIKGAVNVCRGEQETYTISPIENATSYSWSYSGSAIADSITNNPSVTLLFDTAFNAGTLKVRGMNDVCINPGMASNDLFININTQPSATIRNADDTINTTDNLCKNTRNHYYVVEEFRSYRWVVQNGEIVGDSTLREVAISWGTAEGSGELTVTVEDQHGCSGSSVRKVSIMNATAPSPSEIWRFGYNLLVCSDSLVNSYQWYNDNMLIQDATKRYFLADTNNRKCYYVQTCIDACCNMSDPFCFISPSAIHDLTGSKIRIFPNPATDKIQIRVDPAMDPGGHLAIFNQYGVIITELDMITRDLQTDMSLLPRGLYYLTYFNGRDGIYTSKIIKF